jgi:hypothetical protein
MLIYVLGELMNRKLLTLLMMLLFTTSLALAETRAVPTKPVITAPANGSTVETHAPLLQWTVDGAETFKVVIKNAAGVTVLKKGGLVAADLCAGTDCSYSFGAENLSLPNGQMTLKVVAKNAEGKAKSDASTFTVNFPGTPELVSPADNDTSGNTNPGFTWNEVAQADQYRVKVKNTVTGAKVNSDWQAASSLCGGGICIFSFDPPFNLGTYKWSVEARQVTFPESVSKSAKRTLTIAPE